MTTRRLRNPNTKQQRIARRNNPTPEEATLWQELQANRIGVKVRRQQGIGEYIVSFYVPNVKLAIDIDECSHYDEKVIANKKQKDDYIRSQGIEVVRVPEVAIDNALLEVCEILENEIASRKNAQGLNRRF